MSGLTWLLFESPLALGAVLLLVLYGFLVYWRRGGRRGVFLGACVIAAGLLLTQQLVVTQREHARAVLRPIEQDLEAGRTAALQAALASDFSAGAYDRKQLVDAVARRLHTLRLRNIEQTSLEVEPGPGERFDAVAAYTCNVLGSEWGNQSLRTRWRFEFVQEVGAWRLAAIRSVWVETIEMPLAEVLR